MTYWSKGNIFASLRKRVARDIKEHREDNLALREARAPLALRVLRSVFSERGLLAFLVPYAVVAGAVLVAEIAVAKLWPCLIPPWSDSPAIGSLLRNVTSYLLSAQVVMVGLLFPIAVGLVTLIVQREDASSTVSDVQVYYEETLAYRVGASGIALSMVLALQLVWPAHFAIHRLGLDAPFGLSKVILSAIHLLWLVINLSALWHFLLTSLSFMRPAERALLRRRFAANISIPRDLSDRWMRALYVSAGESLLKGSNPSDVGNRMPSLLFGSDIRDWGQVEIANPKFSGKALHDVWMTPLSWAVRRWWNRCKKEQTHGYSRGNEPTLVFVPQLRRPLSEDGIICRRSHGVPLTPLEKCLIRHSFRLRKEEGL